MDSVVPEEFDPLFLSAALAPRTALKAESMHG